MVSGGRDTAAGEQRVDTERKGSLDCIALMSQKSIIMLSSVAQPLLSDPAASLHRRLYSIGTN